MLYKIPLKLIPQPEGGYTVVSSLLPELITEGDTAEEALKHAQDALAAVLEAYEDLGRTLPPELHPANTRRPVELETLLTV